MSSVNDIIRLAAEFDFAILKIAKPSFIADQKIWNRAKKVTKKYWKDYENPYPVVVHVYENMGGKIKKKKKSKKKRASIEHLILKYSLDANTMIPEIKKTIETAIGNASTQKSSGIMPFVAMLAQDHATLAMNVTRNGGEITVTPATVNPGEFAPKYAALPQQVQGYLTRYLELFPAMRNGEPVEYSNVTLNLQFGVPSAIATN